MFSLMNLINKNISSNCITDEQLAFWDKNGYLVLENFFHEKALSNYNAELDKIITYRREKAGEITIDVLEGNLAGKRMRLSEASDEAITCAHKINDLFLESQACRNLNLDKKLCSVLRSLLKNEPLIINSLSFKKGSQQPFHFDTYYMPPPVTDMMVVSSICLENQSPDSGPISYYPGSHKIPPYVFSHGGIHANANEMPLANTYIQEKITELNLKPETFIGKAGDVFIWHAQLYHGGTPIKNHSRTRKTLVTHYWRKTDVDKSRVVTIKNSGSYLLREHQNVS